MNTERSSSDPIARLTKTLCIPRVYRMARPPPHVTCTFFTFSLFLNETLYCIWYVYKYNVETPVVLFVFTIDIL
ncbi:hypothetical protein ANN_26256 [Periplaneta americana]|uniref:Uncharacterized protein n=1 Tax=Periplaneta americana TaxID=6978 RepID=A0ABQ8S5E9_PERAM|nr:hypothetical protein ANN_26256 [Periplaneta americana]